MIGNKYILAAALACAPLAAHADETVYTFDSVTAVENTSIDGLARITGILANDTVPTTAQLPWSSSSVMLTSCQSMISRMMSDPGVYLLTLGTEIVTSTSFPGGPPPTTTLYLRRCKLERKP